MSLVYILYVLGNSGDMDDTENYVEHVFAVLREYLDAKTPTALLSLAAPRCGTQGNRARASSWRDRDQK